MNNIKKNIKSCLKLDDHIKFGKVFGKWQQVFLDSGQEVFFNLNDDKTDITHPWYVHRENITTLKN